MHFAHRVGLRQDEDVVVAAQIARPIGEPRAAIARFAELERLDFGPHGAVEDKDRLGGAPAKLGLHGERGDGCHRGRTRFDRLHAETLFYLPLEGGGRQRSRRVG